MKSICFRLLSSFLFGLFFLFNATAEGYDLPGCSLTGRIMDQSSKSPVEFASIALYNAADSSFVSGAISDRNGFFRFERIVEGSYYLEVSFVGYEKKAIKSFSLTKSIVPTDLGTIELSFSTQEIDEVNVVAERARVEYRIDKRVINVDKDLSARGGTAVDALQNTPSVQVDHQGRLTLRGSSDYTVLIDGKPSLLKGSDALKQIPAAAIKQLEVITNPSAKYESDGQAGIINVIMKKEMLQGFSGSMNYGISTTDKQNGNLSISNRKKNLNVFGGFDYADNIYRDHIDIDSRFMMDWGGEQNTGEVREFSTNQNLGVRAGLDWDINKKNALSISGGISRQAYDNGNNATTASQSSETGTYQYTKSSVYLDVYGMVYSVNVDYTHHFSGSSKLMVTNNLTTWSGRDQNDQENFFTNEAYAGDSIAFVNRYIKDNHNYTYRLNLDYTDSIFTGSLEAGAQFRYEPRYEDLNYLDFSPVNHTWTANDSFSYVLNYENTIFSGYASYTDVFLGLGYKLGLRSEYFMRSMDLGKEDGPIEYNKFMFYPGIHLSRDIKENLSVQASYSRRINRPQPWLLNTTPRYIDTRNIFLGNTKLIPEYTDAFELNLRNAGKKLSTYVQTYFRNTINSLSVTRQMRGDGIMYHQLTNSKGTQALGIELGFDHKIMKWWQMNTNINLYNYKQTTTISNTDLVQKIVTGDIRFANNFNLKTGTRIQLMAYYHAPGVDAAGKTSGYYVVDMSVGQSLLKGAMNISLSGQNLFPNTYTYRVEDARSLNIYEIGFEGRALMVNLSYNFNNFENKQRGRHDDTQFGGNSGF